MSFGVFFSTKKCVLYLKKMQFRVCFLKIFRPPKMVGCFILNNLHFPMVDCIAFYALYKSRMLIIPYKADDFCLFIGLSDQIQRSRLVCLSNLEFNFFIVLWSNLKETLHY